MNDMGYTRYQSQIEEGEIKKCEKMRRAYGLIFNNDPESFDCSCCELSINGKCV